MSAVLHLGDCLDPVSGMASLPDKSVDVVLTDPPYEAEAHTLQRRIKPSGWRHRPEGTQAESCPLDFEPITHEQRTLAAAHFARIAVRRVLVFSQVEAVVAWRDALNAAGATYRRTIPWIKPDAMPSLHGRWPGQAFESIVLATIEGAEPCPIGGKAVWYDHSRHEAGRRTNGHLTVKPLGLMESLVRDFTDPGDLILDPFAGSGTTGVAARKLGRRFVGWEKDPKYHAAALARINATVEQLDLMPATSPRMKQTRMGGL